MKNTHTHITHIIFLFALLSCILLNGLNTAYAQALTKGKDFWLGYMNNLYIDPGGLRVYVSSEINTNATVDIPGLAFTLTLPVAANSTTQFTLPDAAEVEIDQVPQNKGVHVTSPTDVYVFGLNYGTATADATLVLPTPTLGIDYMVLMDSESNFVPYEFMVVSAANATDIEIIPTQNTTTGSPANVPFTITLNQGEVYQVRSNNDLTGSRVRVTNNNGSGCITGKPIAVFSGHECANFGSSACDHIYELNFPIPTLGQKYVHVPLLTQNGVEIIKIMAVSNNTQVFINGGLVATLNAGQSYRQAGGNNALVIEGSNPIAVALFTSNTGGIGDPDELMLTSVDVLATTNITTSGLNLTGNGYQHFVNLVTATANTANINLNPPPISCDAWTPTAFDPAISFRRCEVNSSNTTITSSGTGFNVFIYGLGSYDSYSYSGGGLIQNFAFDVQPNAACAGQSTSFTATSSYPQIADYVWDWGDGSPLENGPSDTRPHTYTACGQYNMSVQFTLPNNGGAFCLTKPIQVVAPPNVTISASPNQFICGQTGSSVLSFNVTGSCGGSWAIDYSQDGVPQTPLTGTGDGVFTVNTANLTATTIFTLNSTTVAGNCSAPLNGNTTITFTGGLSITPSPPTITCPGGTVNFSANPFDPNYTYQWTGPGFNPPAGINATLSNAQPANTGTYTITVSDGTCTTTATTTLDVTDIVPTANNNSPLICGENLTLTGTAPVGATFSWQGPNNFSSTLLNPNISIAGLEAAGIYTFTATLNGCTGTATTTVLINPLPTPTVGVSQNPICAGNNLSFTSDINSLPGVSFLWQGPNNFSSTLQNPAINNIQPAASGTYTLTVTRGTCVAQTTINLTVNPPPTVVAGSNSPVCSGYTLDLFANTIPGATYTWNGPNNFGSNIQNPSIISVPLAAAGIYTLTVSVGGCPPIQTTTSVNIKQTPGVPTVSNNGPLLCDGNNLELYANNILGGLYSWTGPANFVSNQQNPTINPATQANSGTYTLTITLNGCTSPPGLTTVTVNPNPTPPFIGNNGPICEGQALNLTASPTPGAIYSWTGPQTFQSVAQNPTINPAGTVHAGVYYLYITVDGCTSGLASTTVVVNTTPPTPPVSNNGPLCEGELLQLFTPAQVGATYSWLGPNGFNSFFQNPVKALVTTADEGAYSLTVTINGCTSPAGITPVVIHPIPNAPGASNNSPLCVGQTLNLVAGGIPFATYHWTGPNNFSSSLQNPILNNVQVNQSGNYSVTATVNGCTSPVSVTNVIISLPPTAPPMLMNNGPMCVGQDLQLSASLIPGGTYTWTGPNGFNSNLQNPVIPNAQTFHAGNYSLTVSVGNCVTDLVTTLVAINPLPAPPSVGNNTPVCIGQLMQFTASSPYQNATYNWTGPNSFSSTQQNPGRGFNSAADLGTYSVTVTIPGLGCTSAAATTIATGNVLPAIPAVQSNSPLCTGQTLLLTGENVPGATYQWTGPGGFTSTLQSPTRTNVTTIMAGTYSLVVKVGTCTSLAGTVVVSITQKPDAPFASNNGPICAGSPLALFASPINNATYIWSGPNVFSSNQQNPVIVSPTVANTGIYSVQSVINGCVSNIAVTSVSVKASPAAPTAGNNSPLCVGQTLQLTAQTITGATYQWTGPAAYVSATKNPTISNVSAIYNGQFSLTVTVNGCTSPVSTTNVSINGANFTPTVGSNSPLCLGSTLNLSTATIPGATYQWTGPNNFSSNLQNPVIPSVGNLQSGAYSLVVTTGGCTSAVGVTQVMVNAIPNIPNIGNNSPICEGQTLTLTSNFVAGATYQWIGPSAFNSTAQNPNFPAQASSAGIYTLVITQNGCTSAPATTTVTLNPPPAAPIASSNSPLCMGATAVNLNLFATAVPGAVYQWTGPAGFISNLQNPIIINANPTHVGMYSVQITLNGCTSSVATTTVTLGTIPGMPSVSTNAPVCEGQPLQLISNSIPNAIYQWTGPNAFISSQQSPIINPATLAADGQYSLTVTVNGCTSNVATVYAQIKPLPNTPLVSSNSPICEGNNLALSATNVNPGASYIWTGPNNFNSTAQNPVVVNASPAASGVYSLVMSLNGCSAPVVTLNAVVNPIPNPPAISTNSPICEGDNLFLTISNPIVGASYQWTGPNSFTSTASSPSIVGANSIHSGTYTVVVTLNGCTATSVATTNVQIKVRPATPSIANNGPICEGQTLQLSASSATPGVSFNWTGPLAFSSNAQNPTVSNTPVAASGTYAVTTVLNGCASATSAATVAIVNPKPTGLTAASNSPVCFGGQLQLSASPILGASYYWVGPNNYTSTVQNPVITNMGTAQAGMYSVYATVAGCSSEVMSTNVVLVNVPNTPIANSNSPVCAGGMLLLTVANPISGGMYQWSGPGFSSTLQNPALASISTLSSGVYSVQVTVGGCTSAVGTVVVTVNPVPAVPIISANTPLCAGQNLNLSTATVPNATYQWIGPAGFSVAAQNAIRPNIQTNGAGVYSLTVTVGNCSSVGTRAIAVNPIPAPPTVTSNSPVCTGQTVHLTASSIPGASYSWTGPLAFTSILQNPSIVSATTQNTGSYTVKATVNGCTSAGASTTVVVRNLPAAPSAGSNSPVCTNGTIVLTASLTAGATYQWSGPAAFNTTQQNPTINNANAVNAGVYSVSLTAGGCTSPITTVTVDVIPPPTGLTAGNSGPVCVGKVLNLSAGFIAGATYQWTGPGGFSSNEQNPSIFNIQPSMAGVYSLTVNNGTCTAMVTTAVTVSAKPTVVATSNSPICEGGVLQLSASGTPGASYSWVGPAAFVSNTQNPTIIAVNSLHAGTYTVTATLAGCDSEPAKVTVMVKPNPNAPIIGNNGPLCVGQTLLLTTNVSGVLYQWTGPASFSSTLANPILNNIQANQAGVYSLVVTQNGCTSAISVTNVVINSPASGLSISNNSPICAGETLSLSASLVPGATYQWSGPAGFSSTEQNPVITATTTLNSGVYTLFVSLNGCASLPTQTSVTVKPVPTLGALSSNSPICEGQTLSLQAPTVSGVTYSWVGPNAFIANVQNPIINPATTNATGTYSATVTLNGCTSMPSEIIVKVNAKPQTPVLSSNAPLCVGNTLNLTANNVLGNPTYLWSGPNGFLSGAANPVISNVTANANGVYSLILTENGCSSSMAMINVVVNNVPVVPSIGSNSPICAGGTLLLTAPTIANATYEWVGPNAFVSNTQSPVVTGVTTNATGLYILTVTQNGCTSIPVQIQVKVNEIPLSPIVGNNGPLCPGSVLQLTATAPNGTFSWVGPNNFNSSAQEPTINNVSNLNSGIYSVQVTHNGCTSAPATTTVVVHAKPTANWATANTSVCKGESNTLSVTLTGAGPWTVHYVGLNGTESQILGDANSPSPATLTFSLSPLQTTTYMLTGVDDANCSNNANGNAVVTVKVPPTASILGNPSTDICSGGIVSVPVTFTGSGPWTLAYNLNGIAQTPLVLGGSGSGSPATFNLTFNVQETTTLSLVNVLSGNGCTNVGDGSFVANIATAPTASWGSTNATVCAGSTVSLPITLTGKGPWNIEYKENTVLKTVVLGAIGSPSPSVFDFTVNPSVSTTYTITQIIDGSNCVATLNESVVVSVNPLPIASLTSGSVSICSGESVPMNFNISGVGPFEVSYTVDGVLQSEIWNVPISPFTLTLSPTLSGLYTAVSVKDANGCSGSASGSKNIIVKESPTATITGGGTICNNGNGAVFTLVTTGTGPWTIAYTANGITQTPWVLGNSNSASPAVFTITVNPTVATTYNLVNVADASICPGMAQGEVIVTPVLAPKANFIGNSGSICAGDTMNLSIKLEGTGPWTVEYAANSIAQVPLVFGSPDSPSPSTFSFSVSATVVTTYSILNVHSGNGCTGATNSIYVLSPAALPTAVSNTPNLNACVGTPALIPVVFTGAGPWTLNYTLGGENMPPVTLGNVNSPSPSTFTLSVNAFVPTTLSLTSVNSGSNCIGTASGNTYLNVSPRPTANFETSNIQTCANAAGPVSVSLPIIFTGQGPWTIVYTRNGVIQPPITFGDANSEETATFIMNVSTTANTTYSIINVTDANGCMSPGGSMVNVTIHPLPTANFTITSTSICAGQIAQVPIQVTGSGPWMISYIPSGGQSQLIQVGNPNSPSPTTFMLTFSPSNTTLYSIVSVSDTNNCSRNLLSRVTVNVVPQPTATIQGETIICAGQSANINVTLNGKGPWIVEYLANGVVQPAVTFGSANSPSPSTFTLPVSPTVSTTYTLSSVSSGLCTGTVTGFASVQVNNATTISLVNRTPASCGQCGSLTVSGANSYTLSNGMTSMTGTFECLQPGNYVVTGTTENGCTGTLNVTIEGSLALPQITSINNITSTSATVSWSGVPGAQSYTLAYRPVGSADFTMITNIGTLNTTLTNLTPGVSYEVKVKALCSNGSSSPYSDIQEFSTPLQTICGTPTSISVNANSSTTATVNWSSVGSAVCYIVRYGPITANEGTWASVLVPAPTTQVILTNLIPGTLYGLRVQTNCTLCSTRSGTRSATTSVSTFTTLTAKGEYLANDLVATEHLSLYPNPNRGSFVLTYTSPEVKTELMRIFDATGRLVMDRKWELELGENQLPVALEHLASGIYSLNLGNHTIKIVIQ